jgi:hypothetical protein
MRRFASSLIAPSRTDDTISNRLLEASKLLPIDRLQMLSFRGQEPFHISKDDPISHLASSFGRPDVNSSRSVPPIAMHFFEQDL